MNKKKRNAGIAGGAVAVLAAVIITLTGTQEIEIDYSITQKSEYVTVMNINVPNENADIASLYLNGVEVDKTLLPNGSFTAIPLVFEDLSLLEVKLYSLGEYIGSAKFEDKAVDGDA